MKIIGIIGSRRRDSTADLVKVAEAFKLFYEDGDIIVSGGCRKGGDRFAEMIAKQMDIEIIIHYPESVPYNSPKWAYAKANYDRNTLIARDADLLIACVAEDRKGGTEDTIKKYLKLDKNQLYIVG